jgi:hypothetical protein
MDHMIHCPKSALPLHSYYSEFRLGQGDPLLKAAMKRWPFATRRNEECPYSSSLPSRPSLTRALTGPPCRVLSDPSVVVLGERLPTDIILHMDNVGHIEGNGERRYVLMSDDRAARTKTSDP